MTASTAGGLTHLLRWSTPGDAAPSATPRRWYGPLALGVAAAALALIRDGTLLAVFAYGTTADSPLWIAGATIRPRPYVLLSTLMQADSTREPLGLIWLQIALGALAIGALVFVLARFDLLLALAVGVLFLLDFNWAAMNRWLMVEGPFMTFHVLCLACLVYQYERRRSLRWWELGLAGALYGWSFAMRPSGLALIPPVLLAYWLFTRSWRQVGELTAGLGSMLFALALLTQVQAGYFGLFGGTGPYAATAIFMYHLFGPDNGPVSHQIDAALRECLPDVNYESLSLANGDPFIHSQMGPCLGTHWDNETASDLLNRAYLEAITHRPVQWLTAVADNNGAMFVYIVGWAAAPLDLAMSESYRPWRWCDSILGRLSRHPAEREAILHLRQRVGDFTMSATQLHLAGFARLAGMDVANFANYQFIFPVWRAHWPALLLIWIGSLAWILLLAPNPLRVAVLACVVFIHITIMTTVVGVVFSPRYAHVLSPFYAFLSATFVVVSVRFFCTGIYRGVVAYVRMASAARQPEPIE